MRKWISISNKKGWHEAPVKVCGNCGKLSVGAKDVEDLERAMIEALESAKIIPA